LALPFIVKEMKSKGEVIDSSRWAKKWTPFLAVTRTTEWFRQAEEEAMQAEWPTVDEITQALRITRQEAEQIRLYSLTSFDRTKDVRDEEGRERDRLRKWMKSREQGRDTREQQRAKETALREAKEALARELGISKRQLNRKIAAGLVDVPAMSDTYLIAKGSRIDLGHQDQPPVVVDIPALLSNDNTLPDFSDIKNIRRGKSSIRYYQMTFPAIAYDLHVLHAHLKEMDEEAGKIGNPHRRLQRRRTKWVLAELERRNIAAGGRKPFTTAPPVRKAA
jgi:hypothetical protein